MVDSFTNPTLGQLSLDETVSAICQFLQEDSGSDYSLVIGSDSQEKRVNGHAEVDFVTAIVVHRHGRGGRYFWQKIKKNKVPTLRNKIYTETMLSLNLAQILVPAVKKHLNGQVSNYNLEIHIDVGEFGQTREMIKEVVGMVAGNGFCVKTKPEAYGAYVVADKHT
ncbi:ribonuclease H-like YkuK family protein [Candidatus Microgenomates bacterium]|nr:ribonuclease H-like YkuK family protein [Candidatus Microgenomates bacterium]